MRRAITAGFDYSQFDDADDVMEKVIDALKRFDIQAFLTYHPDKPDIVSVDLYRFTDNVDVSFEKPPIDDATLEKIFLEYLASYDTLKTKGSKD